MGVRGLKVEQETQIWQYAAEHYGESLTSIVNDAQMPGIALRKLSWHIATASSTQRLANAEE